MNKYPIYCINITDAKERYEKMYKRIDRLIRWDATTPTSELFNKYPLNSALSAKEKACSISHYSLWEYLLERGVEMVLILEDDILFRDGWEEIVDKGLNEIKDWHMLLLNSTEEANIQNKWVLTNNQYLAGAYLINREGLQWLVNTYKTMLWGADYMTMTLQYQNKTYVLFPWLAIQEGKDSQIQTKEHLEADHAKVLRLLKLTDKCYEDYH
jgi:GR25 family glycosyltransferase involved in LPS biosynthesis